MSTRKSSHEAVEKMLREDAHDPTAWEEPIRVAPSQSARPGWYRQSKHLDLAGRFFLLSVLHRLGSEATLTWSAPGDVDVAAFLPSGEALTIDVKTLAGTSQWRVDDFKVSAQHFVAFVCFKRPAAKPKKLDVPDLYIWSSRWLKSRVLELRHRELVSLEQLASQQNPVEALQQFVTHEAG